MRLKEIEIVSIKKSTNLIFGKNSKVYLFGSRVDDNKKGGDIDLYIIPGIKDNIYQKKFNFLVKLEQEIGMQKIDVIMAKDKNRLIEKEAISTGILL